MVHIIDFSPPMQGIEGEFNTFRLGGAWAKRVQPTDKVILMDKKAMGMLGWGEVIAIHIGRLDDLSALYGSRNHNQKHLPQEGAGDRVTAAMIKRYGPNLCRYDSKCCVIELKLIE